THNHYHVAVQEGLQAQTALGMNLTRNLSLQNAARLRQVQDEHVAIVDAIAARDAAGARAAMERHIENARRRMFEGAPANRE
ncbi:MAG: FCD domain-containing protein, partial [Beijerinckiaceae bacterium]|nr:FCD domain-containing protein [Beijerinckiaceae bacterium]